MKYLITVTLRRATDPRIKFYTVTRTEGPPVTNVSDGVVLLNLDDNAVAIYPLDALECVEVNTQ